MNIGRLILTIIAVAVVLFVFDMLYHGGLLGSSYGETADAWRTDEEMAARFPLQIVCYFLIAIGFCTVWAFGFGEQGVKCGAIYGFFLGIMATGGTLINFVFLPIPDQFMLPWAVGGILSTIIAGVLTALIYKPKSSPDIS